MAITQAMATSFKVALLDGEVQLQLLIPQVTKCLVLGTQQGVRALL